MTRPGHPVRRTASGEVAAFAAAVRPDHLPPTVRQRAKLLILDAIGVAMAARREVSAEQALSVLSCLSANAAGEATVVGQASPALRRDAALLNGTLVHGLDFDDTHPGGSVHATASALPAALASAEALACSGDDFLAAYVAGVEVTTRLGYAAPGAFHARGLHPTGLLGTFGATIAAARLHGLDADGITAAQGIALSLAPGAPMEFMAEAAPTKRLHAGWAAVCGITAAALATAGYEGPTRAYEGERGLYAAYLGAKPGAALADALVDGLGTRWEILTVEPKRYPTCHLTHPFLDTLLDLRERYVIDPNEVREVTCWIAPAAVPTVCEPIESKRRPASSIAAQFSLPYVSASALVHGAVGLDELEPEAIADSRVRALAANVRYETMPVRSWTADGRVAVTMANGQVFRGTSGGDPGGENGAAPGPMVEEHRLRAKYTANATRLVESPQAAAVMAAVDTVDEPGGLALLSTALRAAGPPLPV